MNKLITFYLSILTLTTFGQNIVDVGLEGGFSTASLRGNDYINNSQKSRIGHSAGIFAQYNFKKLFSLRTGAYYERKGSSSEMQATDQYGNPSIIVHEKQNYEYLTIPVLLKVQFGNKFKYFFNVGPYLGILLKQSVHWDEIPGTYGSNTSNFNNTEIGLASGIGVSYNFKHIAIGLEVRDNLGLTDVNENYLYNGGAIKTNALYFLLGASYKIGERNAEEKK